METWEEEEEETGTEEIGDWFNKMLQGEIATGKLIWDVTAGGLSTEIMGGITLRSWVEGMRTGEVALGRTWLDLVTEPATVWGDEEKPKVVAKAPPRRRASRRASSVAVPAPDIIRMELKVTQRRIDELQSRTTLKNPYKLVYLRTRLANLEQQLQDSEEQWERSKTPAGMMETWEEEAEEDS
mmetsp:Transcript_22869/g.54058  ORF Transcript_22869/g.54058 Transcript_22869/m.54058 type:complete len:183 (-) Transcript_22869:158-706(-)